MKKHMLNVLIFGMIYSLSSFANTLKPYKIETCKNSAILSVAIPAIHSIDPTFNSDSSSCKIVWVKSVFPKKDKSGVVHFEKGLQISIYQDYQLKYICLPGWVCKKWR